MNRSYIAGLVAIVAVGGVYGSASASDTLRQFDTPSHNIGCIASHMDGVWNLRCDIREHSYRAPAQPASCDLDYGDSLNLGRTGKARWTCHGDTALPPPNGSGFRTIRYGTSWAWGPFRCTSRTSGMTCTNVSRKGFVLSRQRAGRISV